MSVGWRMFGSSATVLLAVVLYLTPFDKRYWPVVTAVASIISAGMWCFWW